MQANISDNKGLLGAISCLADRVLRLCSRVESVPGKQLELWAMTIYAAAHLVMAIFHEPWYDEAVAWQIARCASLKDILFEIPHYEGHPPLWHLILLPFAKLGAPYELSLTLVSLIFAGAAVGLIIWKSPFPRIVRLLLPFTYFFFYQYGVISRPYCVMMLAFMLLAMNYHNRNEKPGRYTLCLMLLCLTSAYGIVIAGGLAIVWVWEIWNLQNIGKFLKTFPKDKRIWWLAALLVLALLLIAEIMPREDTFATNLLSDRAEKNSLAVCLLYMLFGSIADVSLTSMYASDGLLQVVSLDPYSLAAVCLLGGMTWVCALFWGRSRGTALLFVIPYGLFAVFASCVYISRHHIGVGLLIFVFWLWVSCLSERKRDGIAITQRESKLIHSGVTLFFALCTAMSLVWNIASCIKDGFSIYATGREEAAFIAEHNLDQYQIMVGWDVFYDEEDNISGMDINHCYCADNVVPYFDKNIFFNFNDGDDQRCYSTHISAGDNETAVRLSNWENTVPDVLFMDPELELVYGDTVTMSDYTLVYSQVNGKIWKGTSYTGRSDIYVRNELAEELGLIKVEVDYPWFFEFVMWLKQ